LANRKKEADIERIETLKQIELNKRPQGTIRLADSEINSIRESLSVRKEGLQKQITKSSVTLYT